MATTEKAAAPKRHGLTGAIDLFWKSKDLVMKNLKVFIILNIITILFTVLDMAGRNSDTNDVGMGLGFLFGNSAFGPNAPSSPWAAGLAVFGMVIVFLVIESLLAILTLRTAQGKRPSVGNIFEEFKQKGPKLFFLLVLTVLITGVGFLFLIVPGVILLWRLFFAPYILVDKNVSIGDALNQSWAMTRGYAWPIYSIILFGVLLGVTSLTPWIGAAIALALSMLYSVAPALRYEEIKKLI